MAKPLTYTDTIEVKVKPEHIRTYIRECSMVDAVSFIKAALAAMHYSEVERTWELVRDDPQMREQFKSVIELFETYSGYLRKVVEQDEQNTAHVAD